ncbi:hypothetical protein GCM10027074_73580 [Streptomyces deserti]
MHRGLTEVVRADPSPGTCRWEARAYGASCCSRYGGRPPVITDDMPHAVLRRRVLGEPVERIQPDLITCKRESPSVASIYRARCWAQPTRFVAVPA